MILRVSPSTLQNVARCGTKTALRALNYDTDSKRVALDAGKHAHQALAQWLLGYSNKNAVDVFKSLMDTLDLEPDEDTYTPENLGVILEEFMGTYQGRLPFSVERFGFEGQFTDAVEWPLEAPIGKLKADYDDPIEVRIIVILDAAVRAKVDKALYSLEWKTTGRISAPWVESFSVDPQNSAAIYALQYTTGEKVAGGYLGGIQFSRLPNSNRRCNEHGCKYSECTRSHAKWELQAVTRTPESLEAWRKDALRLAKEYYRILTTYQTLESVSNANQKGKFNQGCINRDSRCEYFKYCHLAMRTPSLSEGLLFDAGEGDVGDKVRSGLYDDDGTLLLPRRKEQ